MVQFHKKRRSLRKKYDGFAKQSSLFPVRDMFHNGDIWSYLVKDSTYAFV